VVLEGIVTGMLEAVLGGGPKAIIALLVMFIGALLWDRRRLLSEISRKDDRIERILDDYAKGNTTLAEALNQLRMVLFEIKSKL
jgi:hypothetical protein